MSPWTTGRVRAALELPPDPIVGAAAVHELLTRWRADPVEAHVDPGHDGNAFSVYYYSRLDVHLGDGSVFDCEDLRDRCRGVAADDGYPGSYSYLAVDTSPDAVAGPGAALRATTGVSRR